MSDDSIALVAGLAGAASFLGSDIEPDQSQASRAGLHDRPRTAVGRHGRDADLRDRSEGRLRVVTTALPVLAVVVLVLCTAYQGVRVARNTTGVELRDSQREAAAVLVANTDELPSRTPSASGRTPPSWDAPMRWDTRARAGRSSTPPPTY
jgi:hypothetical protein